MSRSWQRTILGEPVSSKNSRRVVTTGRGQFARTRVIKSAKALCYAQDFAKQCPVMRTPLAGRLRFTATLYYRSERPDLDESLILDLLQGRVYANDRQVRVRLVRHEIDRENPRAEILIEEIP